MPPKRKEPAISHDVQLELDLLEQEEATTQRWSLRFTSEAMERRFQWYHEDISLPSSRRACAATIAALLVMQAGAVVQLEQRRWPCLVATLSLHAVLALGWLALLLASRRSSTLHGRFQLVLSVTAVGAVLVVLLQPAVDERPTSQQLPQTMLFLLMVLSAIATLWNVQFLVYCGVAGASGAALAAWLAVAGRAFVARQWHAVVLLVLTLWSLGRGVYHVERSARAKFLRIRHLLLENLKLTQQNTFMQQQLSSYVDAIGISGVEASGSTDSASIEQSASTVGLGESAMEHVLKALYQLKLQLTGQPEMARELEDVMQTLASDQDLFRGARGLARRYSPASRSPVGAHDGSEAWLHLIDEQRHQWRRRKSLDAASPIGHVVKPLRRTTSGLRQTVLRQVDSYLTARHPWTAKKLLARATSSDGDMDVLGLAAVCRHPLTSVLLATLEAHSLFVALPLRLETVTAFALEIEARYQVKNPYHNAVHGAFVVWDLHGFLRRLQAELSPVHVLAALLAGAVHDVNHPGLSNAYLVATSSPLAIKYSDDSVLERMHLAEAFQACTKDGCDVFDGLAKDQRRQSRKLMVTMVLATDLAGHLKHVSKLKSKRYVARPVEPARTDRVLLSAADDLLFQTLIIMADLGHAAKPFAVHFAWASRVAEEFFRQGDVEKQFQLPVSPLCDREAAHFDASQVGFLEVVVLPLYAAARDVLPLPLDAALETIRGNYATWKRRAESVEHGRVPPTEAHDETPTTLREEDETDGSSEAVEASLVSVDGELTREE